jgi:hypothetical protein
MLNNLNMTVSNSTITATSKRSFARHQLQTQLPSLQTRSASYAMTNKMALCESRYDIGLPWFVLTGQQGTRLIEVIHHGLHAFGVEYIRVRYDVLQEQTNSCDFVLFLPFKNLERTYRTLHDRVKVATAEQHRYHWHIIAQIEHH